MLSLIDKIAEAQKQGREAAICIVVATHGSTPRKTGAKMLVFANGSIQGTIGGGDLEKKVIQNAKKVLQEKRPQLFKHDLLNYHQMCCGGNMEIYIEPIMNKKRLYIFGAGHTGHALAKHAMTMDFEIVIIDDRKEYLDEIVLDHVEKICLPYQEILPVLPFNENTFVCIMTYSHPFDREILAWCIRKPFAYLGMIGSQRKVEMTRKMFIEGKLATEEELKKVDMPMGIDIGAEGPEEIAISILSKLISVKNSVHHG